MFLFLCATLWYLILCIFRIFVYVSFIIYYFIVFDIMHFMGFLFIFGCKSGDLGSELFDLNGLEFLLY